MHPFLPSEYSFSTDKLINFSDYQRSVTNRIVICSLVCILLGLIAGILAFMLLYDTYDDYKHGKRGIGIPIWTVAGILVAFTMILCFSAIPISLDGWHTEEFTKQDFHYPITDSNLVIKCADTNNLVDNLVRDLPGKRRSTNIPQSIHDKEKYPYDLYVKRSDSNLKYYLGTMINGKFKPENTYIAGVFYKYIQYIQDHHLENEFKQNMYFIQNSKYLSGNKVQWILTNNHDTTLHLVDNTIIKESKIVAN